MGLNGATYQDTEPRQEGSQLAFRSTPRRGSDMRDGVALYARLLLYAAATMLLHALRQHLLIVTLNQLRHRRRAMGDGVAWTVFAADVATGLTLQSADAAAMHAAA
jgi:hypothetical protein